MKFLICKTSDRFVHPQIPSQYMEINSLEELLKLQIDCGSPIIINNGHIEIYDEERE